MWKEKRMFCLSSSYFPRCSQRIGSVAVKHLHAAGRRYNTVDLKVFFDAAAAAVAAARNIWPGPGSTQWSSWRRCVQVVVYKAMFRERRWERQRSARFFSSNWDTLLTLSLLRSCAKMQLVLKKNRVLLKKKKKKPCYWWWWWTCQRLSQQQPSDSNSKPKTLLVNSWLWIL